MSGKMRYMLLVCAVIAALFTAMMPAPTVRAADVDIQLISVMRQDEPVTAYLTDNTMVATFDPQRAEDVVSINVIEQLFLGLTNSDPLTPGSIVPELATSWTTDESGTKWTFTIRDDVPWVKWDAVSDTATEIRKVTAGDIAYGIQRSCDPRLAAYYSTISAQVILGCNDLLTKAQEEVTEADYSMVQVAALDDTTLEINLEYPAGFFFSMTPMWMLRPVPQEVIAEFGDDWIEPENMITNGPYVIDEYVRGVRRVYLRNPLIPSDLVGPGNVERVIYTTVEDGGTVFALYQDNQIDISGVPAAELQAVLNDPAYEDQLQQGSDLAVAYYGFAYDKPPFDNVHARRAFSAIVDRETLIQQVRQGRGVPMIHLTPPGMFGAPPINDVGVGYNPEWAKTELEAAGYPNCEGMPPLHMVVDTGAGDYGEFLAASAERELGCDANIFTVEQMEFTVRLQTTKASNSTEDRPNIWLALWGPDYPDANNWVGSVLSCEFSDNDFKRPCNEIDDLIDQAAREIDPDKRIELYAQIEEMFFGTEGEYPIAPIYMRLTYTLYKPWYTGPFETDGLFGGAHLDWRTVDQEVQQAARNG
ncbi:MAG TPA: peptide ABC transporter substrate-binding protein [Aggregatilineaceae bacterium]|nr:peptide ABC transporter substrate-binding protein [Aggregatilineaceae bacterium]